jgi:hypothetical protein
MPPKGKKGQDKGKSSEEERDEPLQAVVSYAMRLRHGNMHANIFRYSQTLLKHASAPSHSSTHESVYLARCWSHADCA